MLLEDFKANWPNQGLEPKTRVFSILISEPIGMGRFGNWLNGETLPPALLLLFEPGCMKVPLVSHAATKFAAITNANIRANIFVIECLPFLGKLLFTL